MGMGDRVLDLAKVAVDPRFSEITQRAAREANKGGYFTLSDFLCQLTADELSQLLLMGELGFGDGVKNYAELLELIVLVTVLAAGEGLYLVTDHEVTVAISKLITFTNFFTLSKRGVLEVDASLFTLGDDLSPAVSAWLKRSTEVGKPKPRS